MRKHSQAGFTIVELMIASMVFSVVLLVCTFGLLQIGRTYYKSLTLIRTQETTRSVIDEISRAIQFSGGSIQETPAAVPPSAGGGGYFCIGDYRYSFRTGFQLVDAITDPSDQSRNVLVVDTDPSCSASQNLASGSLTASSKELLAPKMRLAKMEVRCVPVSGSCSSLYSVTVRVVYGDRDLLNGAEDACVSGQNSSQFCAVSELSTTVYKRVK